MLVNLSMDIIFFLKLTVFLEFGSRRTLHFRTDNVCGQISVHIFKPNGDYCSYSYLSRVTIVSSANKCSLRVLVFDVILVVEL